MRSPGFTGESAIRPAAGHYRTTWPLGGGGPALTTALSVPGRFGGRDPGCIPGCICVTQEGCPCCSAVTTRPPTTTRNAALHSAPAMVTTCEPGTADICQDWCDHAGGGMSSNPDGSTTCTVYM